MFKVKAGTLQISMYIIVVVALLLAGFILFVHTHKLTEIKSSLTKQVVQDTQFGINYLTKTNISPMDTLDIAKEQDKKGSLKVHAEYWGIFEKITSISKIKNKHFTKIALVGGEPDAFNRTALYLQERNKPLVVVGDAFIQGTSYLPYEGVRTGNISGHSFYGEKLIDGKVYSSKTGLPRLSPKLIENIRNIELDINTLKTEQFLDIYSKPTHKNSFKAPLKVVYSTSKFGLVNFNLIGNIIIQSSSKIVVDASTHLTDVILIAPEIEIRSGTKGSFQAFATRNILIEEGCYLSYPSALIINEKLNHTMQNSNVKQTPSITINKGCSINGVVAFMGVINNYKSQVFIDESSEINGEVYCNKNLELLGTVNGSVFTSSFVANQSGSSYQNHLYNGKIILNNLSEAYSGLLFDRQEKAIVKCLY